MPFLALNKSLSTLSSVLITSCFQRQCKKVKKYKQNKRVGRDFRALLIQPPLDELSHPATTGPPNLCRQRRPTADPIGQTTLADGIQEKSFVRHSVCPLEYPTTFQISVQWK